MEQFSGIIINLVLTLSRLFMKNLKADLYLEFLYLPLLFSFFWCVGLRKFLCFAT